jgi:phosphoribosylanthranilate isomerase
MRASSVSDISSTLSTSERVVCFQHRLPRKRRVDDTAAGKAAPLAPAVAVVVNANDVPWRELLHQKEIFFVLVHAAHAKQTGRRDKRPV